MAAVEGKRYARVIFSGTRDDAAIETDRETIARMVRYWARLATEVGVGDCPTGIDALVRDSLRFEALTLLVFHADWDAHGKAAGPRRNGELVQWAAAAQGESALIAFPAPLSRSRGRGTKDCVAQAIDAGLGVIVRPVGVRHGGG